MSHTHSAAALNARTGSVLGELTVEATPDGYRQLVKPSPTSNQALRAWAIEGTGGHGAGLARLLGDRREVVVELDRPERSKRRNGAKSDPLDAIRAAREALSRAKLGTPRAAGDRQALSVLLAARRSAVESARCPAAAVLAGHRRPRGAAHQVPGQKIPAMLRARRPATNQLRLGSRDGDDRHVSARPGPPLGRAERRGGRSPREGHRRHRPLLATRAARPKGVGPIVAATLLCAWSHPGRVRSEAAFAMLGASPPSRRTAARP
jgi:transposase